MRDKSFQNRSSESKGIYAVAVICPEGNYSGGYFTGDGVVFRAVKYKLVELCYNIPALINTGSA